MVIETIMQHVLKDYLFCLLLRETGSLKDELQKQSLMKHTSPVILEFSNNSLAIMSRICLFCTKPFIASSSVSSMYCQKNESYINNRDDKHKTESIHG